MKELIVFNKLNLQQFGFVKWNQPPVLLYGLIVATGEGYETILTEAVVVVCGVMIVWLLQAIPCNNRDRQR